MLASDTLRALLVLGFVLVRSAETLPILYVVAFAQASVLTLYEPTRSQTVLEGGAIRTWEDFLRQLRAALAGPRGSQGAGLRFLTETVTSPTLAAQLHDLLSARDFREARWYQYEPAGRHNASAPPTSVSWSFRPTGSTSRD